MVSLGKKLSFTHTCMFEPQHKISVNQIKVYIYMYAFYHWKVIPINEDSSRSKFPIINILPNLLIYPYIYVGILKINQNNQIILKQIDTWTIDNNHFSLLALDIFPYDLKFLQPLWTFVRSGNDRQIAIRCILLDAVSKWSGINSE